MDPLLTRAIGRAAVLEPPPPLPPRLLNLLSRRKFLCRQMLRKQLSMRSQWCEVRHPCCVTKLDSHSVPIRLGWMLSMQKPLRLNFLADLKHSSSIPRREHNRTRRKTPLLSTAFHASTMRPSSALLISVFSVLVDLALVSMILEHTIEAMNKNGLQVLRQSPPPSRHVSHFRKRKSAKALPFELPPHEALDQSTSEKYRKVQCMCE